jgi:hypothetical protein
MSFHHLLKLAHLQTKNGGGGKVLTCPHLNITADDLPHLVSCLAPVQRCMDVVAVMLCWKGWEHQGTIGVH